MAPADSAGSAQERCIRQEISQRLASFTAEDLTTPPEGLSVVTDAADPRFRRVGDASDEMRRLITLADRIMEEARKASAPYWILLDELKRTQRAPREIRDLVGVKGQPKKLERLKQLRFDLLFLNDLQQTLHLLLSLEMRRGFDGLAGVRALVLGEDWSVYATEDPTLDLFDLITGPLGLD